MGRLFLAIFLTLIFPRFTLAAEIRAFVDRTSVSPEESVQLTVTIKGSKATVDTSPIRDFKVMSAGTSSSVQIINSEISREVSYNYILYPLGEGRLIIPSLAVISNSKSYKTQPIVITVSQKLRRDNITDTIFVEASVSNDTPFEGQQIIYTFKLFRQVQISKANFQKPAFSGFTAKEMGEQKSYTTVIAGRQFNVSAITYVLIPINPGEKTIEPAVLECDIPKPRQRRSNSPFDSFFDDPFFGGANIERRIYRAKPLTIQVNPLPAYTGDGDFSGLVGEFSIEARVENQQLHVGDSTTLSVIVKGRGNIMDAGEPAVSVPEGFKTYKDDPEEDIQLDPNGFSGQKIFRIALVPIEPGNYELPPVQLSYFDVSKNQYRIRSTPAISLDIIPSTTKEALNAFSDAEPNPSPIKKKVEFTGRDILPLNESLDALENQRSLSMISFLLLLLAPAVFYLGVRGLVILIGKDDSPALKMAKRSEKALKTARSACKSDSTEMADVFFSQLYRALVSGILSKAGIIGESLTYTEAEKLLDSQGLSNEMGKKAALLLEKIESAKFGGLAMETGGKSDLYDETERLIRSLLKK